MNRIELSIAKDARRRAGEAGLAAITYVKAVKTKGEDGHTDWRVEQAYTLARSAASLAREYIGFTEGRVFYPQAAAR